MGTRFRLLFLLLLASLLSTAATGQSQTSPAKNNAAPPKADNSQQAIILEQADNRLVFQNDGTGTRESSERIRVQSEAGVHALAVLSFAYSTSNETLDVDYVRVRKPDGTVIATPAYNIQDMPADVTRAAPMYSDIHEKHVAVRGLGVGDELEYLLRYHVIKPEVPGQFWFEHTFPKTVIAKDELLQISVPREKYVKVSSPEFKPEINDQGTTRVYTWKTSNLQVEDSSAQAGKLEAPQPSVQLTTFHSWDEIGRWYSQLQAPQAGVTPDIRVKAEELTKGLTSDDAKIHAIYNYVATRFHYISLSFGIGRYQPHSAEEVLGNEYGDCKDKHTLLQALLKAAGYDAYPALINSRRKLDPDVPSPAQFDHVITAVARGGTLQWLDTTTEVAPFGLLTANLRDKQALLLQPDKPTSLVTTPANPPFPTDDVFTVDAKLSSDGTLTGHIQHTSRGDVELIYRLAFRQVPEAQWKTLVQRISYASGFGGEVSAVTASTPEDTTKPFQYAYDYTRKEYSDWKDGRITPPMPPFGVEVRGDEDKKPTEPVRLGAPGNIVHRARIQLRGDPLNLPRDVDLTTDFADYHSTYTIKDGVLTAERRLVLKKDRVRLAEWEAYRKFGKLVANDEDTWINLSGDNNTAESAHNSPADRAFLQGYEALQKRDLTTAGEDFRRVIQLDPKYAYAHGNLGLVYLAQNDNEDAFEELRKEEELHPENEFAYRAFAFALVRLQRNEEAMEQWRKLLKVDPKNRDAALGLGGMLITAKKYGEAVTVLEEAAKLAPDSQALQSTLGYAYLKNGQSDKGIPVLEKVAQSDSKPNTLNNIAYELADANVELDKALAYAQKAVEQTQAQSLLFGASSTESLRIATQLAAYWDTLGWVYFRRGDLSKAESYLRAAWDLSQSAVIGDHLAQVYEHLGKKREAEHTYRLALAAARGTSGDEIREHYQHLTGKKPDQEWHCCVLSPQEELSRVRSTKLATKSRPSGSATYALAFSPGKVDEVSYISGDSSLKAIGQQLSSTKFHIEFPDQEPVKLVRRGILTCGSMGCDFVLLLPGDAAASALVSGR